MHPLAAPGTLWVLSRVGKYLVRPQADETSHKKQLPCSRQEKGLPFFFPYHKGFRLCGGDQGAFRSPPGPLRGPSLYAWAKPTTRNKLLAEGRKRAYLSFSRITKDFASAEATKGLSGRPLETFGPFAVDENCTNLQQMRTMQICNRWKLCKFVADKHCKNSFL